MYTSPSIPYGSLSLQGMIKALEKAMWYREGDFHTESSSWDEDWEGWRVYYADGSHAHLIAIICYQELS